MTDNKKKKSVDTETVPMGEPKTPKTTKKYIVAATMADDNRGGFYHCNIGFKEYRLELNKPVTLDDSILSFLNNAEIINIKGSNLKDEKTYVDIEKDVFETQIRKRFTVTEV